LISYEEIYRVKNNRQQDAILESEDFEMKDIELKPCPFCGGKAYFRILSNSSSHHCVELCFQYRMPELRNKTTKRNNL